MRFGVRKGACVTTLLFALLTVICLAGCGAGGDGGDGQIKILTDSRYVRIERLGISVGSCRSDNPDSADAVRSGDGRYVIVRAFSEGNAVISVGDFIGREASIAVTTGSDGKIISCEVSEYDGDDAGVDVLVAGAAGNGSTNDTEAIQNVIDSFGPDGGVVYIPAGRYRVDRLILRDNISIIMQGSLGTAADGYTGELSKRIENGEFAVLVDNLTVNNFLINHDPAGSGRNGCGNITVKGGVIDLNGYTVSGKQIDSKQLGPAENSGRGDTCAFVFSCASGLTVEDVIFRDSYNGHGFQITGAEDVLIKNCLFAGFTIRSNTAGSNTDLVLTRETIQIEYAHSGAIPPSSFRDGEYYHCRNVEINGCCFTKSDRAGYIMVPIGQHGMNGAPNCTGLKIINNVFDNPYLYGIHLLSYEDVEITGNTFVSSLKNVGYSPDECAFIFCDLRNGTQRYAGRDGSGKDVTVTYCNSWENRGTHNVRIEDNDFIIAGNSFFRVLTAQGNDYDTGAVTVRNQIRQEDGSLTGVPYTGFLPVQNVIEGLYFRGNRVTLGGKPSGGHDLIVISDVRDLDISGNSMEGYSGFGSFYGGIEGVSLSGIKNGPDAARKTVLTSLNDRYIELPLGDGVCRLFSDGGERKVTVEAGEGVKDISVNISPDGSCSIGITAEKSAGKTVWETVGGDAALSPGSAVLTGDVTLRVNVK